MVTLTARGASGLGPESVPEVEPLPLRERIDEAEEDERLPSIADIEREEARLENLRAIHEAPEPVFGQIEDGRYRLTVPSIVGSFEVAHLRRDRGQLHGVLTVRAELPSARGFDGIITHDTLNLSSATRRKSLAAHLAERAGTREDVDFLGLLDRLSIQVSAAEESADDCQNLADDVPEREDGERTIDGFPLSMDSPNLIFGDGSAGKSFFALYLLGRLAQAGVRVALFDWEWRFSKHAKRLRSLFGPNPPPIIYSRCAPFGTLPEQAQRLRRIVRTHAIQFAAFDSAAPACGKPEASEAVTLYFNALESLGELGSLHLAHIVKNGEHADQRPFGSTFWHNLCRSSWFLKKAEQVPNDPAVRIALHDRKFNDGPARDSLGFEFDHQVEKTTVRRFDPARDPDTAERVPAFQRIRSLLLRDGPQTPAAIVEELGDKPDSVRMALRRASTKGHVRKLPDGRFSMASYQRDA